MRRLMNDNSAAKLSHNEQLKSGCPTLAGTIAETLADPAAACFSGDDAEFLKFHGIYQGDDRDVRKSGKEYSFLVRARLPGGRLTAAQYLALDALATRDGNNTLRLTSRQSVQLHGIVKSGLRPVMKGLQDALLTTLAACGDVARNVMAPSAPTSELVAEIQEEAERLSSALLPQTPAYRRIWAEGQAAQTATAVDSSRASQVGRNQGFTDPLYGRAYLPRKFKVALALPPLNDVDVFTQCLGLVAIVEGRRIAGYDLLAGGGMGMSFGNPQTFARLADPIGFVTPQQLTPTVQAVLGIHRDFGDRTNRKHARLKYVLEERGVDWFRSELEARAGFRLQAARPFTFTSHGDSLGWQRQFDGNYFVGVYVEAGRVKDSSSCQLKSALRKVVEQFQSELRVTASQNILLAGVKAADRQPVTNLLAEHGVEVEKSVSAIRRTAMACPALPTCGRALAEAERALPQLLDSIESLLAEVGLKDEPVSFRMTGCPNGCDRPLLAEVALVGRAPGKYNLYLGGSAGGGLLGKLFREGVKQEEIPSELRPVLERFARERLAGERLGEFCQRVG